MDNRSIKNLKYALYGLFLRGTLADLLNVFSLKSLVPVIDFVSIGLFLLGMIELIKIEGRFVRNSTLFFVILWGLSTYMHPANTEYVKDNYMQFFVYCLPFMWFGYFFIKRSFYLDLLLPIAKVKLVLALIVQSIILIAPSRDIFDGDYQTAAYSIIVGLVVTYYLALRDRKQVDILLSFLGTLILLICGSRSVFLSVIFFWVVYFISQLSIKRKILFISFFVILFSVFSVQQLISPIASLAESLGFSTHLTAAISEGSIFEDESRELLYMGFLKLIWEKPYGYGIMGDRFISYTTGLSWKPMYPHNMFLELMVNFGYIAGILLSVILVFLLVKFLFFCKNTKYTMTVLILTTTSVIKLLFASSFWIDQMFFMLIGTMVAYKYVNNKII